MEMSVHEDATQKIGLYKYIEDVFIYFVLPLLGLAQHRLFLEIQAL
jgi:hypothetical protein